MFHITQAQCCRLAKVTYVGVQPSWPELMLYSGGKIHL